MSLFQLIEQRRFQEFCDVYEEHAKSQRENPEFADLVFGNYLIALLGSKNYKKIVALCLEEISKNENRRKGPDRSSSNIYIACSIAKMELGQEDAVETLYKGRKASYQDLSRTALPCVLYYESVMLGDEKARKESLKLLKARLENKENTSPYFAIAHFITGGYTEAEMLNQLDRLTPVLQERHKAKARFYAAIKQFEQGNMAEYISHLQAINDLYTLCPAIVMEPEYHLAQICLAKAANQQEIM